MPIFGREKSYSFPQKSQEDGIKKKKHGEHENTCVNDSPNSSNWDLGNYGLQHGKLSLFRKSHIVQLEVDGHTQTNICALLTSKFKV